MQVGHFLKDRQSKNSEWEKIEWEKLVRSNQATLVLMQRLAERGLVTQEMLKMAALPTIPPPWRVQDGSVMNADSVAMPLPPNEGADSAEEIQRHPDQPAAHKQETSAPHPTAPPQQRPVRGVGPAGAKASQSAASTLGALHAPAHLGEHIWASA
jgi:hypothetical protein